MKTVSEFNCTEMQEELEHAVKMSLAVIHYTFNDSKDSEFITENEMDKLHHALECITMVYELKSHHSL